MPAGNRQAALEGEKEMLSLYDLTVEQRTEPLGIDEMYPAFSWKLKSDQNNVFQKTYRLCVKDGEKTVWDSGTANSEQSTFVVYGGPVLKERTRYTWSVTVSDGNETAEAESFFETGLQSGRSFEGCAEWITHGMSHEETASPVFTKTFCVAKDVERARLYATALGVYEAECNKERITDGKGEDYFAPGWTNYHKRLQYQTYPVTLVQGVNELRFTLGKGWYCGKLGFNPQPDNYGDTTALLAMLVIEYTDGSEEIVGTNETWTVSKGTIMFSEIYDGEKQDTSAKETQLGNAQRYQYSYEILTAQENEPVRCLKRLDPVKSFVTPAKELVYDFGQNLTGWVEIEIEGKKGQTLSLDHAESLDENGNFYNENLSFAKANDTYVFNGTKQILRPHFTYHGFRYIRVKGLEENQEVKFTACHLSSDLRQTGKFECSNELVNRLQKNIVWSQRDNYLDVPTDCPQRSERLGWTGDATAFGPTAAFNENILPFMKKWLRDLVSEQNPDIGMPQIVPNIMGDGQGGAAYWGDVATVLPWTLYQAYGDTRILCEQIDSMKMWVDYITSQCNEAGLWQSGFQYGDWLGLDAEMNALGDSRKGATDDYFTANACYLWSLKIIADSARVLGRNDEEKKYTELREKVLAAFRDEYVSKTGRLVCETQTAMILALYLDLVEEKHRKRIADALKANIEAHKTHLITGFIGTPYACLTLSDNGMHELAGKLLLQEQNPGWMYEIRMGATTIWERWDSIMPDGSFNPANMNSLNHYAYGSIGNWMYTKLAGLEMTEPGYKKFSLKPQFIKGIESLNMSFESVYGKIGIAYSCGNGKITVDAEVPANTQAVLTLPEKEDTIELGSGVYHYEYETETDLSLSRYTMETPLRVMMEHPVGKAMIMQYMPEMAENRMIEYVIDEPISSLLAYAPQAQPLYEAIINAMNKAEKQQ